MRSPESGSLSLLLLWSLGCNALTPFSTFPNWGAFLVVQCVYLQCLLGGLCKENSSGCSAPFSSESLLSEVQKHTREPGKYLAVCLQKFFGLTYKCAHRKAGYPSISLKASAPSRVSIEMGFPSTPFGGCCIWGLICKHQQYAWTPLPSIMTCSVKSPVFWKGHWCSRGFVTKRAKSGPVADNNNQG